MKVGDAIRLKSTGQVGLILSRHRRTEICGPENDFMIHYSYMILFEDGKRMIRRLQSIETINDH